MADQWENVQNFGTKMVLAYQRGDMQQTFKVPILLFIYLFDGK